MSSLRRIGYGTGGNSNGDDSGSGDLDHDGGGNGCEMRFDIGAPNSFVLFMVLAYARLASVATYSTQLCICDIVK